MGKTRIVQKFLREHRSSFDEELISSWPLRVSFANGLTLAQLIEAIETRFLEIRFNALSSMTSYHPELALPVTIERLSREGRRLESLNASL
jgi:hypothetical protein